MGADGILEAAAFVTVRLHLLVSFLASTIVEAVVENGWACLNSSRSSTH